jgi:hypothetical protein
MASAIDHCGSLGEGRASSAEYPGMAAIMVPGPRHPRSDLPDLSPEVPAPPSTL